MVIAGFLSFFVSTAAWQAAPEKNGFWVGKIILELNSGDCWIPFFLCLQLLGRLPRKKMIFGSGKLFSGTVESGHCWGFSRVCCDFFVCCG